MRVLLNVSYLGTNYVGWQFQENGISVQETLEKALFEATGQSIRVTGASRTDSGVHALGQRAHFDTLATIPAERYPFVLNRYLPEDVRVMLGQRVPEDFHARFDAKRKTYTYRIYNAPHPGTCRCPWTRKKWTVLSGRSWGPTILPPSPPPAARRRPPSARCWTRRSRAPGR